MRLPFGAFVPDIAELDAGVAAVATNVYPGLNSYLPVKGATPYSSALPAAPRGLFMAARQDGSYVGFAGTETGLFRLNGTTHDWDDVSRAAGGAYLVPPDEQWVFSQFGAIVIAVNANNEPQKFDVEIGLLFEDLGGSPPKARYVDVVEDYLVLASLSDDQFAIAWSDTNDAEEWSTGNSDVQSFPDGGRVQNIAGAAGLVIQERCIRQMVHQPGAAVVFTFTKIEQAKGTVAPYSVVKLGGTVGYLAEDGFWFNGENISAEKVTNYFLGLVDLSRIFAVVGAVDPVAPRLRWAYRTSESEVYDRQLIFNWHTKAWSEIVDNVLIVGSIATPGVTLEGLDALYATLEDIPYSLDSRVWLGGRPTFGVFNSVYELCFYEGDTLEATLETGERQLMDGRRAMVNEVRPLVETSAALARVSKRERLADARVWSSEAAMAASGRCPVRAAGRYHRFRVRIPAGETWQHARGVEVMAGPMGTR